MTIGVQLGSIQEGQAAEVEEKVADVTTESRDRIPELIQEINSGRFDAVIIANTVAENYIDGNDNLYGFILENETQEEGNAVAFQKGSELVDEFNEVIQKMEANGELDELIMKWFDSEQPQQ